MTAAEATGVSPQTTTPWPAPRGRALLLFAAALALGAGTTGWMAWSGRNTALGYVESASAVVSSNVAGRIQEIAVAEGARVEPGQKIAVIVDETLESQIAALRRRVDQLHGELDQARARADIDLKWRMKELDRELLQTRLKSAGYMQSQYDQEIEQHVWSEFLNNALIQPVEMFVTAAPEPILYPSIHPATLPREARLRAVMRQEAARNALEVSQAQVEMCEARLKELEALKKDLPAQIARSHGVEMAEAQLAKASEELSVLESKPREIEIAAPIHGTVGLFRKFGGERVNAGEPIVTLLDEEQRFLSLRIPSRRAPEFPANGEVSITFPGGKVRTGRIGTVPPQVLADGSTVRSEPPRDSLIPLRIVPIEKLWPEVPIGTAVDVRPMR